MLPPIESIEFTNWTPKVFLLNQSHVETISQTVSDRDTEMIYDVKSFNSSTSSQLTIGHWQLTIICNKKPAPAGLMAFLF